MNMSANISEDLDFVLDVNPGLGLLGHLLVLFLNLKNFLLFSIAIEPVLPYQQYASCPPHSHQYLSFNNSHPDGVNDISLWFDLHFSVDHGDEHYFMYPFATLSSEKRLVQVLSPLKIDILYLILSCMTSLRIL